MLNMDVTKEPNQDEGTSVMVSTPINSIEDTLSLRVPPNTILQSTNQNIPANYFNTPDKFICTLASVSSTQEIKEIEFFEERSNSEISRASYSWVVDMSNKRNNPDNEENSSENAIKTSIQAKKGSCFYVDLNDVTGVLNDNKEVSLTKKIPYTIKRQVIKSKSVTVSAGPTPTFRLSLNHSHYGWNLIDYCESELGKKLLKMFLEESGTDVAVEASGRKIRAHTHILEYRCQYFAGVLGGAYVQSAGNIIILPSYTYDVAHFALCNIYSGVSYIPPNVNVNELAALADMLGLDGLKDAIALNLEAKYCHSFHDPCEVCIKGVLKCLYLSSSYGLEELLSKCIAWTTTYFHILWPKPNFNTLPDHLKKKCYQQHIIHFSMDTLLEKLNGCSTSLQGLPNTRSASSVKLMLKKLVADLAELVALKLKDAFEIIFNEMLNIPQNTIQTVHMCITIAIKKATLVQVEVGNNYLNEIFKMVNIFSPHHNTTWLNILEKWSLQCESIIANKSQELHMEMGLQSDNKTVKTRKSLDVSNMILNRKSRGTPKPSKVNRPTGSETFNNSLVLSPRVLSMSHSESQFTKLSPSKQANASKKTVEPNLFIDPVRETRAPQRSNPKLDNPPAYSVRMTKAQMERMKFNRSFTQVKETKKPVNIIKKFENTKSRYMELRQPKVENTKMCSSDKSPVSPLPSNRKNRGGQKASSSISQDSLATTQASTVSRSESQISNRFGTYTRSKKPKIDYPSGPLVKKPGATRIPIAKVYAQPKTKTTDINKVPTIMKRSGTFSKDEPTFASANVGSSTNIE